jgi:hypothetical protein
MEDPGRTSRRIQKAKVKIQKWGDGIGNEKCKMKKVKWKRWMVVYCCVY